MFFQDECAIPLLPKLLSVTFTGENDVPILATHTNVAIPGKSDDQAYAARGTSQSREKATIRHTQPEERRIPGKKRRSGHTQPEERRIPGKKRRSGIRSPKNVASRGKKRRSASYPELNAAPKSILMFFQPIKDCIRTFHP